MLEESLEVSLFADRVDACSQTHAPRFRALPCPDLLHHSPRRAPCQHIESVASPVARPAASKRFNMLASSFDLSDWWKSRCVTLPVFAYVFCAVLTNSLNSCPSECLFSIFNATYNDNQKSSRTDYIQLPMQAQFNNEH